MTKKEFLAILDDQEVQMRISQITAGSMREQIAICGGARRINGDRLVRQISDYLARQSLESFCRHS